MNVFNKKMLLASKIELTLGSQSIYIFRIYQSYKIKKYKPSSKRLLPYWLFDINFEQSNKLFSNSDFSLKIIIHGSD